MPAASQAGIRRRATGPLAIAWARRVAAKATNRKQPEVARPGALEVSGEVVVEDRGIEAHTQSEANIVPLPGHHEHDKTRNCEGENFNHLEGDVYAIRLFVFDQGEDPHYEEDDGK